MPSDNSWDDRSLYALDSAIILAIDEIHKTYGDIVRPKGKSLLKFGKTSTLGTSRGTIWAAGGNETYVSSNIIDSISSSNAGDTHAVQVEMHTVDVDGNFNFFVQEVTLQGQTRVPLTPGARASRIFNKGAVNFAGDIYVYENSAITSGVPNDATKIHLQAPAASNQSEKMASTIENNNYYLITQVNAGVTKKTSAIVDFQLEVREKGGVFRERMPGGGSNDGPNFSPGMIAPVIIVPPNSDFRVTGLSSSASTLANAWTNGILCEVIN
jgi:hypothetical protein